MKTALLALFVSFSAMASECYVRTVDLVTNEVTMAKEICINGLELKFENFGNSKATIKYSLDGVATERTVNLSSPLELRSGKVLFFVNGLESNFEGGICSDTVEASINAELTMNKDGSEAKLSNIKGSVSTSYDNCHSETREIQAIDFKLI